MSAGTRALIGTRSAEGTFAGGGGRNIRQVVIGNRNDLYAAVLDRAVRQHHGIGAEGFTHETKSFTTCGADKFANVHLPPDELALTLICCGCPVDAAESNVPFSS